MIDIKRNLTSYLFFILCSFYALVKNIKFYKPRLTASIDTLVQDRFESTIITNKLFIVERIYDNYIGLYTFFLTLTLLFFFIKNIQFKENKSLNSLISSITFVVIIYSLLSSIFLIFTIVSRNFDMIFLVFLCLYTFYLSRSRKIIFITPQKLNIIIFCLFLLSFNMHSIFGYTFEIRTKNSFDNVFLFYLVIAYAFLFFLYHFINEKTLKIFNKKIFYKLIIFISVVDSFMLTITQNDYIHNVATYDSHLAPYFNKLPGINYSGLYGNLAPYLQFIFIKEPNLIYTSIFISIISIISIILIFKITNQITDRSSSLIYLVILSFSSLLLIRPMYSTRLFMILLFILVLLKFNEKIFQDDFKIIFLTSLLLILTLINNFTFGIAIFLSFYLSYFVFLAMGSFRLKSLGFFIISNIILFGSINYIGNLFGGSIFHTISSSTSNLSGGFLSNFSFLEFKEHIFYLIFYFAFLSYFLLKKDVFEKINFMPFLFTICSFSLFPYYFVSNDIWHIMPSMIFLFLGLVSSENIFDKENFLTIKYFLIITFIISMKSFVGVGEIVKNDFSLSEISFLGEKEWKENFANGNPDYENFFTDFNAYFEDKKNILTEYPNIHSYFTGSSNLSSEGYVTKYSFELFCEEENLLQDGLIVDRRSLRTSKIFEEDNVLCNEKVNVSNFEEIYYSKLSLVD